MLPLPEAGTGSEFLASSLASTMTSVFSFNGSLLVAYTSDILFSGTNVALIYLYYGLFKLRVEVTAVVLVFDEETSGC